MNYSHLILHERYQIRAWRAQGFSLREIAERLQRSPSTISRELNRNLSRSGVYHEETAHRKAQKRSRLSHSHARIPMSTWNLVEARLRLDHSPEQISAILRQKGFPVSHTRIYRHIAQDRHNGGTLWQHRRFRRRSYRCHPLVPRRFTPHRSIRDRPAIVEARKDIGHWEADTLRPGKGLSALLCLVERKSRYIRLSLLKTGHAKPLALRLIERLKDVQAHVRSLTADRGSEFSWYWLIEDELQAPMYFCDPYCAWQRGTVENTNGLLRQYFPRKRDFSTITEKEVRLVEDRINNRPRKVLNYQTPKKVFYDSIKRCT